MHILTVCCTCRMDARRCTDLPSCPAEPIQPNRSSAPPTFSPDSHKTGSPSSSPTEAPTTSSPSQSPSTSPTDLSTLLPTRDPTQRQVKASHLAFKFPARVWMPFPIILCGCADLLYGYLRELLGPHDDLLCWLGFADIPFS